MRKLGQLFAATLALCLIAGCTPSEPPPAQQGLPPLYQKSELVEAMAEARLSLPHYWAAQGNDTPDLSGFRLKVTTLSKRYTEEPVWLIDIKQTAPGQYAGTFPPEHDGTEDGFTPGDIKAFLDEHIVDWQYKDGDKFRGGFTTRAMFEIARNATGNEMTAMRDRFHDHPLPE